MGKMRVNELAKELNLQNKDLIEKLKNMGYTVKSHLSTLEDTEVDEIRKKLNNKSKEKNDDPITSLFKYAFFNSFWCLPTNIIVYSSFGLYHSFASTFSIKLYANASSLLYVTSTV